MKKDIKIKITNEDGSVKQSSTHEVFFDVPVSQFDPEVARLVEESSKKFMDCGETIDEIVVIETYFYG